jgi:hypothetical protein
MERIEQLTGRVLRRQAGNTAECQDKADVLLAPVLLAVRNRLGRLPQRN